MESSDSSDSIDSSDINESSNSSDSGDRSHSCDEIKLWWELFFSEKFTFTVSNGNESLPKTYLPIWQ